MAASPPPPSSLDHVALWVADRDELGEFLCAHLGMHVIERSGDFTLLGVDARRGKVTLFDADGPREPGPLRRVVLRVSDLDDAIRRLPDSVAVSRTGAGASFEGPQGLGLGLVERDRALDYDLDHVVLVVPDPMASADALAGLGFGRGADGQLAVGDRTLRLEPGAGSAGGGTSNRRPLLNHLALLVSSAEDWREEAERQGAEVAETKDAANTYAVFVNGPDGIKLEYVEHKPGFSLV